MAFAPKLAPASGGERLKRARGLVFQRSAAAAQPQTQQQIDPRQAQRAGAGVRQPLVGGAESSRLPNILPRPQQVPNAGPADPGQAWHVAPRILPRPPGGVPSGPANPNGPWNSQSGGTGTGRTGDAWNMDGTYTRAQAGGPFAHYTGEGYMRSDVPRGTLAVPPNVGNTGVAPNIQWPAMQRSGNDPWDTVGPTPTQGQGFLGMLQAARNAAGARTLRPTGNDPWDTVGRAPPQGPGEAAGQYGTSQSGLLSENAPAGTSDTGGRGATNEEIANQERTVTDQEVADWSDGLRQWAAGNNVRDFHIQDDGTVYFNGTTHGNIRDPNSWDQALADTIGYLPGWSDSRREKHMDQLGITDPVIRDLALEIDNNPKLEVNWGTGAIYESGTQVGSLYDPPETWSGNAANVVKKHPNDPGNKGLYDQRRGSEDEDFNKWLTEMKAALGEAPEMDRGALDEQIRTMRSEQARQQAMALQAMMERASRLGSSPDATTATVAQAQHEAGTKTALQESTMRLQAQMENFRAQMQHYQNQYQMIMAAASMAQDERKSKELFRQAMVMQQLQANAQANMMRMQQELANQITPKDVLGGILGVGGNLLGIGLGGLMFGGGGGRAPRPGAVTVSPSMGSPYPAGYWDPTSTWGGGGGSV